MGLSSCGGRRPAMREGTTRLASGPCSASCGQTASGRIAEGSARSSARVSSTSTDGSGQRAGAQAGAARLWLATACLVPSRCTILRGELS